MARSSGRDDRGAWGAERPPLFLGISQADCVRICSVARVKEFGRGEMLHIEGDPVQQVILLTAGIAKITQLGLSGSEVILRLAVPGDILDSGSLAAAGRHSTTAQTFRLCRALVWDATAFKSLVEPFPIMHRNMNRIIGEHLNEMEERFREVSTERVPLRIARQLMRLLKKVGQPVDGAHKIELSREELAQMTGTTLFTVSRLLSAWEARGMVKPRRESVVICDVRALRAVCEEG
jgi:CRP-like cAMP-binding protein